SDTHYFRKILGITFTNKAANQLKERIIHFLSLIKEGKGDHLLTPIAEKTGLEKDLLCTRAQKVYEEILVNYGSFDICTIDKFIQKVVRSFARDLGLNQHFEVSLSESDIWDEVIENWLISFGSGNNTDDKKLLDFGRSLWRQKQTWDLKRNLHAFCKATLFTGNLNNIPLDFEAIQAKHKEWRKELKAVRDGFSAFLDVLKKGGIELPDLMGGAKGIGSSIQNHIIRVGTTKPADRTINAVKNFPDGLFSKKNLHLLGTLESQPDYPKIQGFMANVDLEDFYLKNVFLNNTTALSLAARLKELFEEYVFDTGQQPIATFKKLVHEIVSKEPIPFIYERIGNRYKHFFIDEFQDTSVLEFEDFIPLIENGLSEGFKSILVGDAKQSIFRFKGGEAQQFVDLPQFSPEIVSQVIREKEGAFERAYYQDNSLDTNWRSCKNIIHFNNHLFNNQKVSSFRVNITEKELFGIPQKSIKAFDFAQQKTQNEIDGYVEITQVEEDSSEWDWTVKKVKECLNSGIAASEICILVRFNKHATAIVELFLEEGIAVKASNALFLSASENLGLLINALEYLVKPNPVSAFQVVYKRNQKAGKPLNYESLKNYMDDPVLGKLKGVSGAFSFAHYVQCLGQILEIPMNDLFVQSFYSLVQDFEKNHGFDVPVLIEKWYSQYYKSNVEIAESEDQVQVLTYHKSKGLEFGTVLIPQIGIKSGGSAREDEIWVEFDGVANLIKPGRLKETSLESIYTEAREKDVLDRLNNYYVACTRAERNLFLEVYDWSEGKWFLDGVKEMKFELKETADKTIFWHGEIAHIKKETLKANSESYAPDLFYGNPSIVVAGSLRDEEQNQRVFGNEVHDLLASLEHKSDLEKGLSEKAWVSSAVDLRTEVIRILDLPDVQNWFDGTPKQVLNEREFLVNGKVLRPDRIMEFEHNWVVVDYKTGSELPKHKKQVFDYKTALERQTGKSVVGYVLYTHNGVLNKV
ncbi:MAG: ATP-dependent exoDNAse (exonuclease V) beta subunit, partial [Sphingobacteriales bacterium]